MTGTAVPPLRVRGRAFLRPSSALIALLLFGLAWLGGTGQTIAVFGALLLLVDVLVPPAGPVEADEQFRRLVRARRLSRGAPLDVLDASTILARSRRDLGVQTIDLDAIAGTVEPAKAREFDRRLRPSAACADRWKPLWVAYRRGDPVPPVSVYRIDGHFWLCDGHHRASVLCHQGARMVDANVTELR